MRPGRGTTGCRFNWRGCKATGTGSEPGVGVQRQGKKTLWRRAHTDGSYLNANDHRVHFGLGRNKEVKAVVVHWPSGTSEIWEGVEADRLVTLQEGSGITRKP